MTRRAMTVSKISSVEGHSMDCNSCTDSGSVKTSMVSFWSVSFKATKNSSLVGASNGISPMGQMQTSVMVAPRLRSLLFW